LRTQPRPASAIALAILLFGASADFAVMDALLAADAPASGKGSASAASGAGAKKPAAAGAAAGGKAGAGAGAAAAPAGSTSLDFFKLLDSDTSVVNHLALLDARGRTAADVRALELPLLAIVESVVRRCVFITCVLALCGHRAVLFATSLQPLMYLLCAPFPVCGIPA
jgi:hypothetical protein